MGYGKFRSFYIHDPKKRLIHAACFKDRIFHHALMNRCGETFERAMVDNTYACRMGKGVHKAVQHVQKHLHAYPWFVKIDIDGYFAAIHHQRMHEVLMRKFKGDEIHQQFWRVLKSYQTTPTQRGYGLPIGSLTSQYFANYYLDGLDRWLNEDSRVKASIRYMDDVIWWCESKAIARQMLTEVRDYLTQQRQLKVKPTVQLQPSKQGVLYCGFRVSQGTLRLSRRRKKRFQQRRLFWENEYTQGRISSLQLQNVYAAVHSITIGTDSLQWRRKNLKLIQPLVV